MPVVELRAELYFEEHPPSQQLAQRLSELAGARAALAAMEVRDPAARASRRDQGRLLRALADRTLAAMSPAERAAMRRRGLQVVELASLYTDLEGGAS